METNSLFPLKYRLRKTDELVKEYVLRDLANDKVNADKAVAFADSVIAALKPSCPEPPIAVCAE